MIRKNRTHPRRFFAVCLPLLFIGLADMATAGPNCNKNPDHPKCVPEPPPDPGGPADPKVAYLIDGQIYLSNADGSGMTLVRSETDGDRPRLYAGPTGGKVLFYKTLGLGQEEYLAYRSYSLVNGEVVVTTHELARAICENTLTVEQANSPPGAVLLASLQALDAVRFDARISIRSGGPY